MNEIDTANKFFVGLGGAGFDRITFVVPLPREFSRKDALNLAAWIVTLAESEEGEFDKLLKAIKNT